jgi:hypothetical protein
LPTQHPVTQVLHSQVLPHSTGTHLREVGALVARHGNNHLHGYGCNVTEPRWLVALQHGPRHPLTSILMSVTKMD